MNQQPSKITSQPTSKKKWLTLAIVGMGLLLIPRRSSRQDSVHTDNSSAIKPAKKSAKVTTKL